MLKRRFATLSKRLKKMKTPLFLSMLLAVSSVHAESWVRYAQTAEASLYFEKHRIIKMGSTAMIWDLHDLKTAAIDANGNAYRSVLNATEYNCRMGQYRLLSVQRLAGAMGSGSVVSEITEAAGWQESASSATADKLLAEACDLK